MTYVCIVMLALCIVFRRLWVVEKVKRANLELKVNELTSKLERVEVQLDASRDS